MAINDRYKEAVRGLFATQQECDDFLASLQKPIGKSFSVISSRMNSQLLHDATKHDGRTVWSTPFSAQTDTRYVDREDTTIALGKSPYHLAGYFYIQEVAASIPAYLIDLPDNALVLDMCAAPWGKSMQMANRLMNQSPERPWLVVSNDISFTRLKSLGTNANRVGLYNTASISMDGGAFGNACPEMFDAILVDAPCSGEGTWFKSDAAYKRRKQDQIQKIAITQYQLLLSALKATKPWWSIVYSTCTLNIRENESVIMKLLDMYGGCVSVESIDFPGASSGLTMYDGEEICPPEIAEKMIRCRPHKHGTGWFFVCKLRKTWSILPTATHDKKRDKKNKQKQWWPKPRVMVDVSKRYQTIMKDYFQDEFGISIDTDYHSFGATKKYIIAFPSSIKGYLDQLTLEKIGIPVAKHQEGRNIRPVHGTGQLLGDDAQQHIIELDDEQMQKYCLHEDLDGFNEYEQRYYVLKRQGRGVSVGKVVNGTMKNKFVKR